MRFLAIISIVFFSNKILSQIVSFPIRNIVNNTKTVTEIDENLYQFRLQNNIYNYKGYKWLARFINDYSQRSNPDGSLISANEYYAIWKQENEKINAHTRGNNGWYPMGPFNKPGRFSNYGQGRINCISFHPTDTNTFFIGVAQGGIWKTSDGGNSWVELNNGLPILRISDIAIDSNNTQIMYACIGDFEYADVSLKSMDRKRNTHYGMGIFKTINGGISWNSTGLSAAQTSFDGSLFRRVYVNPKNSNELLAAGISGIYKSYNAGNSWVKKSNEVIGDLEMQNTNSNVIYAAGRWLEFEYIGKAKIYKSYNFGETWQTLNTPWPSVDSISRVEIALAPNDSNYIYAVCAGLGLGDLKEIMRSIDGGKNWTIQYKDGYNLLGYMPWSDGSYSQGKYDLALAIHPTNKDKIFLGALHDFVSTNGGQTFNYSAYNNLHVDQHQYQFQPISNKLFICNDGGLYSVKHNINGITFFDVNKGNITYSNSTYLLKNVTIGSYYRLGLHQTDSAILVAGMQDNGTIISNWNFISSGDGMECEIFNEPSGTRTFISSQYGNFGDYLDYNREDFYLSSINSGTGEWTTPMIADLQTTNTSFTDVNDIFILYNEVLTYKDGWKNLDLLNQNRVGTAMDCNDFNNGYLYVATKPYYATQIPTKVYRHKTDVYANPGWTNISAGLPDSIYLTSIAAHKKNKNFVVATYSGFVLNNKVFISKNAGNTWTNISKNLPNIPVNSVVIDTTDALNGMYIGTDIGVYYWNDTSTQWKYFSKNLPNVIVSDLQIDYKHHILYAATFGRAIWAIQLDKIAKSNRIKTNFLPKITIQNPVKNRCSINIKGTGKNKYHCEILDGTGKKAINIQLKNGINLIDINHLSAGIYYVKISAAENYFVEKIMIEK